MTTHNLLALVFAVSCFALSACNMGGTGDLQLPDVTSYPARILSTTQQGCPPEDQQQMIIAEIQQDIILNYLSKCIHVTYCSYTALIQISIVSAVNVHQIIR